jgi:hypothetical protein
MGESGNFFAPAFSAFDAYTYLIMVLVGCSAAFTMRSIGSLVTATMAALAVFATAVFLRDVVSTGFASEQAASLITSDWAGLLTMRFGTLCIYALAIGTITAASYGILMLVRE